MTENVYNYSQKVVDVAGGYQLVITEVNLLGSATNTINVPNGVISSGSCALVPQGNGLTPPTIASINQTQSGPTGVQLQNTEVVTGNTGSAGKFLLLTLHSGNYQL